MLYINWNPSYAIILLGVTTICYVGALICDKQTNKKNIILGCFITLALLPLLVFKYYNFLNNSLLYILNFIGLKFSLPGLNWAIPLGISFYTFQAVGYLLDVYNKRVLVEKNFLDFALFVGFFPQIISGPISTAKELIPQLKKTHIFSYQQGKAGLKNVLGGMFLKCVIADRLGIYVDIVYGNYNYFSGINCLVASFLYSIQIYCDFFGYSLIAIGIAKTLGINLINNFNRPYLSTSVTEFWKKWHISLTRWLTTHIYINLGGNRCSKYRTFINILITFLVSGIWHGANWTFIIWGMVHGFILIIEKILYGDNLKNKIKQKKFSLLISIKIIITFIIINFTWIIFRMPSITDVYNLFGKIFTLNFSQPIIERLSTRDIIYILIGCGLLFIYEFYKEFFGHKTKIKLSNPLEWCIYIIIACLILSIGVLDAGSFIYVSF